MARTRVAVRATWLSFFLADAVARRLRAQRRRLTFAGVTIVFVAPNKSDFDVRYVLSHDGDTLVRDPRIADLQAAQPGKLLEVHEAQVCKVRLPS